MKADSTLRALGIPMFTITGNHDYSSPSWLSTLFPDPCADAVSGIYPLDGLFVSFRGFTITGIPPYTARVFEEKYEEISTQTRHSDVVLYHGFVTGIVPAFTGDKRVLDVAGLPLSSRNKAVLLGDIHVQGFVNKPRPGGGEVLIGYPGSLEMCSKSESTNKSIPMIRLNSDSATVESLVPLEIRTFISKTVKTTEDLDNLVAEVSAVKHSHPVVLVEFDRGLTETVTRLHAILDMQRSVVRCYPLPQEARTAARVKDNEDADTLGIEHFVSSRFAEEPELGDVAMRLLRNGDNNAASIIGDFVQASLDRIAAASV
jgi:DNA repair exonuclease SbcCD nuclease subunit